MENKKFLIVRSQDIVTDTRVIRYENMFKKYRIKYRIVGWDRKGQGLIRENTDYCQIRAGFNLGVRGIIYRIKWSFFLCHYLFCNRNSFDVIHACDLDTIWPALFMKIFRKKVIFDIFDWFSDEVSTKNGIIDFFINKFEKLATQLADLTILCEKERLKQIGIIPSKYIIIPNIPEQMKKVDNAFIDKPINNQLCISYVGGFYPDRGLIELLEVVQDFSDILLCIAGFGKKEIEEKVKNWSKKYPNIIYYGKVGYDQAIEIMQRADLLYAMYYTCNRNNIFAAPNKFYESIFLKKPIITTKHTLIGEKVSAYGTGFVIEEGEDSLRNFFENVNQEKIRKTFKSLENQYKVYNGFFDQCIDSYFISIKKLFD